MGKEPIGSGRRFRALEAKLAQRGDVRNPAALAAAIGRKKYGQKRMAELAEAAKRQPNKPEPYGRRVRV